MLQFSIPSSILFEYLVSEAGGRSKVLFKQWLQQQDSMSSQARAESNTIELAGRFEIFFRFPIELLNEILSLPTNLERVWPVFIK